MKTAVIYARYSSERQTEQSIEGQLRVCNDYAERNDLKIVGTYIDRAMTGKNDNRKDFQRMLRDCSKHEWEIVLVYKLDRFSRNKYEMAMHRVRLVSAMENIPDSPKVSSFNRFSRAWQNITAPSLRRRFAAGKSKVLTRDTGSEDKRPMDTRL